jgi:xyloglucan fucosyltransferase
VLWSPFGGIGNRMLTLVSTFLYALLTNRVMLIDRPADMNDLFCEPFPGSTWYIPLDFPIKNLQGYNLNSQNSYGYMLAHNLIKDDPTSSPTALPPFVYVHLQYNYVDHDLHARFFCEGDQEVINKINWVLLKSDNYIVPGLFMIPKYKQELNWMFPLKETVFHHLGRYLLHPSNSVWDRTMRYYNSYLAKANERIGIQARMFNFAPISIDDMYNQIVACTQEELILPEANPKQPEGSSLALNETKSRAVLVASLHRDFYERLKDLYYTHSTTTGEIISVYQPSHEEKQQFEQQLHNQKALAEIWLLSFSDVLVTTSASTFGYVSYSLAGIKSWFLLSSKDRKVPNPPCRRAVTIDACFHSPPNFNCKTRSKVDTGKLARHVQHCEDFENGVKLFD